MHKGKSHLTKYLKSTTFKNQNLAPTKSLLTKNPLLRLFSLPYKQNYSWNRSNWEYYQGQIEASVRNANKAYIRTKLESSLVDHTRVEIPALRLRRNEDTIDSLKKKGQVACSLVSDHGHETIHFVIEKNQARGVNKLKDKHLRHIFLYIEGKEYNCRFMDIRIHQSIRDF